MLACVPFIGGSVAILSKLMSSSSQEGSDFYGKAGGVATEVSRVGVFVPVYCYIFVPWYELLRFIISIFLGCVCVIWLGCLSVCVCGVYVFLRLSVCQ